MAAAFAGRLGPEMQKRAKLWAAETPNIKKLPLHVKKRRKKLTAGRRKRRGVR